MKYLVAGLGNIGDEYANTRHILLRGLSGNGSWKSINGKSTPPPVQNQEVSEILDFVGMDDTNSAQSKVSFIKRLGYFLLHFDE